MRISDWSSDVCSSDLPSWTELALAIRLYASRKSSLAPLTRLSSIPFEIITHAAMASMKARMTITTQASKVSDENRLQKRSEERRVGKECERRCKSRWSPYH